MTTARALTPTEREWLAVRSYLREHRFELSVQAADEYPGRQVADTPLLANPAWLLTGPIALRDISIELDAIERPISDSLIAATAPVRPVRTDGTKFARYSGAMRELSAPQAFDNKLTYRLTAADLTRPAPTLAFALGRYFDGIDIGEAAAHQYAARQLGSRKLGIREAVGDPCDPERRAMNLAVSTLTLRLDRADRRATFLMHWRDPAKVGHAGGLYQVIPVGVFQPSGEASWNVRNDFSLWRCIVREFAEELCGYGEDYGSETAPIDYDAWGMARQMSEGLGSGRVGAWCLGIGTDPLTYATDLLAVLVIDAELADQLYTAHPRPNSEGHVLSAQSFDAETIECFVAREPVQAAGAALLRLAWSHRSILLA